MVLYTAVTMVVALFTSPLLLHYLGPVPSGGVRVLNDAYGYLTLLELGLGGALGPLLARSLSNGDDTALAATVSAGLRGYAKVTALTVVIGLLLTPVVPWFVKDLSRAQIVDFRIAWLVGLLSFGSLVLLPMRSVIDARQLGYVVNLGLTVQSILVTVLAVLLARAGWGMTGQAAALVFGAWAFNLGITIGVARAHPGLIRAAIAAPPDAQTRLAVRSLSWPTLLVNVSGRVSLLTDNLVIGKILGGGPVTNLYFSQRLVGLGQTVLQAVGNAAWAGMAELHAQGQKEIFNRRLIELSRLVAVLSVAGLGPVVAFNRAFVARWLGLRNPDFTYAGDAVVAVAAVNVFLLAQQSLWAWCFTATGRVRRIAVVGMIAAGINIVASVSLTYALHNVIGPIVGTLIALLSVGAWALPLLLRRDFGTPLRPLLVAVAGPLAWGVVSTAGLLALRPRLPLNGFPAIAAALAVSAFLSLAFSAAVLLTPEDRELWRGRFAALSHSRRPRSPVDINNPA